MVYGPIAMAAIYLFHAVTPNITDISENAVARRGENITLTCSGIGDIPLNVSWLTPSGEVRTSYISEDNDENRLLPNSTWVADTLTFTVASAADGGSYTCVAENEGGSTNTTVVVYVTPYFTTEPSDIITTNGSIENATCSAEAFPPPEIKWVASSVTGSESGSGIGSSGFENGEQLIYISEYLTDSHSLIFDPVLFGDEVSVYWCIASNYYGEIYTRMNVNSKWIFDHTILLSYPG